MNRLQTCFVVTLQMVNLLNFKQFITSTRLFRIFCIWYISKQWVRCGFYVASFEQMQQEDKRSIILIAPASFVHITYLLRWKQRIYHELFCQKKMNDSDSSTEMWTISEKLTNRSILPSIRFCVHYQLLSHIFMTLWQTSLTNFWLMSVTNSEEYTESWFNEIDW